KAEWPSQVIEICRAIGRSPGTVVFGLISSRIPGRRRAGTPRRPFQENPRMRAARRVGLAVLLAAPASLFAQDQYRDPPAAIAAILDARPTPSLSLSPRRDWFVLSDRRGLPSIAEVAEPHLKLAGSRINPTTNGAASTGGFEGFTLQRVRGGERRVV